MRFPFLHILVNTLYLLSFWWQPLWHVWGEILWFWFAFPWLVMLSILYLLAIFVSLGKCLFRSSSHFLFLYFFCLNVFMLNRRIIALQCCVGFCQTAAWIRHRCVYGLCLLNFPPTSHPTPHLSVVIVRSLFLLSFFLYWVQCALWMLTSY